MTFAFDALDRCSSCPIRHRAVCARCDADELKVLESMKYYRTYKAGNTVMWRGDRMDFVASLVSGTATLERTLEDGRKQMVGLMLPSDFVGRPGRDTAVYDVTAISELTLCCFRRKPFEAMIQNTPHVAQRLLEMTLDELDASRDWMLLLGRKTAREKIASFLVLLSKRSKLPDQLLDGTEIKVDLPLTRDAMANYLGLTLETVSRQFSKLKADGVIRLGSAREVIIPDLAALKTEAGDDEGDII